MPVSPRISTGRVEGATRAACCRTAIGGHTLPAGHVMHRGNTVASNMHHRRHRFPIEFGRGRFGNGLVHRRHCIVFQQTCWPAVLVAHDLATGYVGRIGIDTGQF